MNDTKLVEKDGKSYECSPVVHGKKQVGLAPRRVFDTDEEMLEFFGLSVLCGLADRQYNQDTKNAVRAKFAKGATSATSAIKFYNDNPDRRKEIDRLCTIEKMELIAACEQLMGIGENAKADPDKIHWDIL